MLLDPVGRRFPELPPLFGSLTFGIVPAAEKAHFDVRSADREGLLALHRVEDRLARVLLRPHAGQAGGSLEPWVGTGEQLARHALFYGAVECGVASEEVVLAIRHAGVVRVGGCPEAELVRVEAF